MAAIQGMACSFFVIEAALMKIEDVWHPPRLQIRPPIFIIFLGPDSSLGSITRERFVLPRQTMAFWESACDLWYHDPLILYGIIFSTLLEPEKPP